MTTRFRCNYCQGYECISPELLEDIDRPEFRRESPLVTEWRDLRATYDAMGEMHRAAVRVEPLPRMWASRLEWEMGRYEIELGRDAAANPLSDEGRLEFAQQLTYFRGELRGWLASLRRDIALARTNISEPLAPYQHAVATLRSGIHARVWSGVEPPTAEQVANLRVHVNAWRQTILNAQHWAMEEDAFIQDLETTTRDIFRDLRELRRRLHAEYREQQRRLRQDEEGQEMYDFMHNMALE
tara:strand:+ start:103 stop:825 length:723 start_codon:yes stop_codon:yes gene_type:complete